MMLMEDLKNDINNSLKEIQENMSQHLGMKSEVIDEQNTRHRRISGADDNIKIFDSTVKGKCKMQKACSPKHPGNTGHNENTKPKDCRYRREQRFTN